MGIVLWYLAILLQKTLKGRLLIIFAGAMQGEILYAYILNKFQFPYLIGAFASLDVCSLTATFACRMECIRKCRYHTAKSFSFL